LTVIKDKIMGLAEAVLKIEMQQEKIQCLQKALYLCYGHMNADDPDAHVRYAVRQAQEALKE